MDPVADVLAASVELRLDPVDDVGDLPGDELLHVLVGAVVVGAVGDRGAKPVGAGPGAHEHVGGRLGARVRRGRVVRRLLGELGGVVERKVAVDLVGGDVVVADACLRTASSRRKVPSTLCGGTARVGRWSCRCGCSAA